MEDDYRISNRRWILFCGMRQAQGDILLFQSLDDTIAA